MIKSKAGKYRCLNCGDPSARPIHPGCNKRRVRREKMSAIKAAAKAKAEAEKKKAEEAAEESVEVEEE